MKKFLCLAILSVVLPSIGGAQGMRDELTGRGFGPELIFIPSGELLLGSPTSDEERFPDEEPQLAVSIDGFYMGKTEVTVAEFSKFVDATGYQVEAFDNGCFLWRDGKLKFEAKIDYRDIKGFDSSLDHPVVCVNVRDALAYTDWLSAQSGQIYRLPTEAEWEYAARGNTQTSRFWGNDADAACQYANVSDRKMRRRYFTDTREFHDCEDGYIQAAPVAQFEPNPNGLYDVLGNVWEWTCSEMGAYADGFATRCAEQTSRGYRVFKGGAWYITPRGVRTSHRNAGFFGGQVISIGFRVLREIQ